MKVFITLLFLSLHGFLFGQYKIFSDLTNLFDQQIIETHDGGLLLVAGEDCYTPGSITIEGCMYALHLVRTDNDGDTLWTRRIGFSGTLIHIHENSDGSFSLFTIVRDNYECEDIGVGLFGFAAIRIINLLSDGALQSTAQFPSTCELILKDVIPVNDSLFAALGIYSKPFYWDSQEEGRLMIMNKHGDIKSELILPGLDWNRGWLLPAEADTFEMLYIDTTNVIHLVRYDSQLNELLHLENADDYQPCFSSFNRMEVLKFDPQEIWITCREKSGNDRFYHVARFDDQLHLQSSHTNTFNAITNTVELPDGKLLVGASGINDPVTSLNTTLVYLDEQGAFQSSIVMEAPDLERPTQILLMSTDSIVVAGNINCCNMHDTIGPGKSFLLFESSITTSVQDVPQASNFALFPNPSAGDLHIQSADPDALSPDAITFYDPVGKLVLKKTIHQITSPIKTSALESGVYIYVLTHDQIPLGSGRFLKY